jgi:hypothetical protein
MSTVCNPRKRERSGDSESEEIDECLSVDTLDAIGKASQRKKGSTIDHSDYPAEGKSIYLNIKKLLNKKVAVAAHLKETKSKLESGKFPNFVNFRATPFGGSGNMDYITSLSNIVVKAKRDLTLLYCENLAASYRDTKNLIDLKMNELNNILSEEQFDEVYKYLKTGYKIAGQKAANKALVPFRDRPKFFPRWKPSYDKRTPPETPSKSTQPQKPRTPREPKASGNKDAIVKLTTLLAELLKKQNK